jgi:NADPH:quinone reductase-like Zn-dependent oxidoreductase
MSSNKAVTLSGFDPANPTSTIQVQDLAIPTPGEGEVVVKMSLRPVNPADIFSLMGVYPGFQPVSGSVPIAGLEGVGTVAALGAGATKFTVGQRVTGAPFSSVVQGSGTWQQYMKVTEACLVAVPDTVPDAAAAQFYVNPVTVVGLLEELAVPAGEWVLQTAAGSVLGRQLIQVAKKRGIKTINVVRRREQADELKAIGADEVIVSTEEDVTARAKEITGGHGAWGAVDAVGGELFAAAASAVKNGGTCIIYGAMSGLTVSLDSCSLFVFNRLRLLS